MRVGAYLSTIMKTLQALKQIQVSHITKFLLRTA